MDKYYSPEEDTFLLNNVVINYLINITKNSNTNNNSNNSNSNNYNNNKYNNNLNICEIGVGSGYIISNIGKEFKNKFNYYGTDINEYAIKETLKKFENLNLKIKLKKCDLFSGFKKEKKQFDLIIFNTPYLPLEKNQKYESLKLIDKAIYGGKEGFEIIEKFISNLNNFLSNNGTAIILYSTLSKPDKIENILKNNLFNFEIIIKKQLFFEELIILKITKKNELKKLNKIGIKNIKHLANGKHSIVLEGELNKKKIIIKISSAQHIEKEIYFLNRLKNEKFLGKLIKYDKNLLIKEKTNGIIIKNFLKSKKYSKSETIKVINNILKICFKLDKLKINKFEMTNPYKHIFIQDDLSIQIIDFERSIYKENPKNTTQFLQYLLRNSKIFKEKNIIINKEKILKKSKEYKKNYIKFKFEEILN